MYNRLVKFGLKISNRFGKNVRKFQGDFLTFTVVIFAFFIVLFLYFATMVNKDFGYLR